MAGEERERDNRKRYHQPDQSQRRGGMGARVDFPFDRDHQHQATYDGNQIARGVESEGWKAKGGVGVVFSDWSFEGPFGRRWAIGPRGVVWRKRCVSFAVRHV